MPEFKRAPADGAPRDDGASWFDQHRETLGTAGELLGVDIPGIDPGLMIGLAGLVMAGILLKLVLWFARRQRRRLMREAGHDHPDLS